MACLAGPERHARALHYFGDIAGSQHPSKHIVLAYVQHVHFPALGKSFGQP